MTTDTKKTPAKPTDRQQKKPSPAELKKQQETMANFLATGIDFTPFLVDAGDGIEWQFKSDTMPADLARLRDALLSMEKAGADVDALDAAFGKGIEAIQSLMLDAKQVKQFPPPNYGTRAIIWFLMTLTAGKTGFPTEA